MPASNSRATGVVADLFAEDAGFSAGWGLSRPVEALSAGLLSADGLVDWRSVAGRVEAALVEAAAAPDGSAPPPDAERFGPELYAGVAVAQIVSGWAALPGAAGRKLSRLVQVRCHVGRQRRAGGGESNLVLLQYRVWTRTGAGRPRRILAADAAWPLLKDVHAAIAKRLTAKGRQA